MNDKYDHRSWFIRWEWGEKPQVFELPGAYQARCWTFTGGVCSCNPSLSDAYREAEWLRRRIMQ